MADSPTKESEQTGSKGVEEKHDEQEIIGEGNASLLVSRIDGISLPGLATSKHLSQIRDMKVRDDDTWIISYPKSGTHWTWEIANMLRNQSAEICRDSASQHLLELPRPPDLLQIIDGDASPRMIITHLLPQQMPHQLWSSKAKILYIYRNPKDALVSQFHHFHKMRGLTDRAFYGTWNDWMHLHLHFPEQAMYGGLVNHVHSWLERGKTTPAKILPVEYEAMKKEPSVGVQKIADFLGMPLSPELKADIVQQTHIQKMSSVKLGGDMTGYLAGLQTLFFRKGEVGRWKSDFTVAQNEAMDALLNSNPPYKDLSFTYTL